MDTFNIGALAKACEVSVQAIRYYEKEKLLQEPARTVSGYRQYSSAAVKRLRFIRRAKELGFTLDEIRNLLAISDSKDADKSEVKQLTDQKISLIAERIADLERVQTALSNLSDLCSGEGCVESCPIIEALNADEVEKSISVN